MGLTTAMYTGLTGLNVNQARINTIGHNIANVNTTAFKGSRTLFQTQLSQTLSLGTAPTDASGGTNPQQIGLGAAIGTTQRDFTPGSIETTGIVNDLAIDGRGFFVLRTPDGGQVLTRDGAFSLDPQNRLVSLDGNFVQGFAVDGGFHLVPGVLQDITIPLGSATVARATSSVTMDGNLSADGTIATQGSEHRSQQLVAAGGAAATAATPLTALRSADNPSVPLFATGNTIRLSGVAKGERELPTRTFVVGVDGTTLGDLAAWIEASLGIETGPGVPGNPGVAIENGRLVIRGNAGTDNDLDISAANLTSDNAAVSVPLQFTRTGSANGSSVHTSFTVYDSLGTPLVVSATFVLEQKSNTGAIWRYYLESPDASGSRRSLGSGTLAFDPQGNFLQATGNQFSLPRDQSGAATPVVFTLDFSNVHGLSTASSGIVASQQDGYPPGTLVSYSIGQDGVITGTFSNGLTRTLGQVVVATVPNEEGLIALSDNLYTVGPNSGNATVKTAGQLGAGRIISGALELSNVDLAREFIGLVTSSAAFQAASRVISVSSDLLNQLLLAIR